MSSCDYKFIFDDIVDGFSSVHLVESKHNRNSLFSVAIDDSLLRFFSSEKLSPILADLLDLAIAIHFADKLARPLKKRSIVVEVILPVRCPKIFENINSKLHDLLFQYTGDRWSFQFLQRKVGERKAENPSNPSFSLDQGESPTEVTLWSGGLDSLAGLQKRLLDFPDRHFVLVGTGSNNIMHKTQRQVFHAMHMLPHASGRLRFFSIPISANYEGHRYSQNKSHRARGIVFLLIGSAVALKGNIDALHVYENGIGAINLPLPGGTGRDHSKAVHPISLLKVAELISEITGRVFTIKNPFLFSTKAEMCRSFGETLVPVFETISCDSLHREKPIQCGYCSSCILRRQALAAAGIEDKTSYLIPHGSKLEKRHRIYWDLMCKQVDHIGDNTPLCGAIK